MPIDIYRLRQIAEFGLGNALIALSTIHLSTTTGDLTLALRVCGAIGILSIFSGVGLLLRRQRVLGRELLFLLARPMLAFTFVLASLRHA